MSEQLQFPFQQSRGLHSLFFALVPPLDIAHGVAALAEESRRAHALQEPAIAPSRLHVSLFDLGKFYGVPRAKVEAAITAGNLVSMPPFDVMFSEVGSFNTGHPMRPFVLQGGGRHLSLTLFRRILREQLTKVGLGQHVITGLPPHMTLLYADRMVDRHSITPLRWTVADFLLIDSLIGHGCYRQLARWPLRWQPG